jgi:hypothetical protein
MVHGAKAGRGRCFERLGWKVEEHSVVAKNKLPYMSSSCGLKTYV